MRVRTIVFLLFVFCLEFSTELNAQNVEELDFHINDINAPKYDDSDKDRHGKLHAFNLVDYLGDKRKAFVDTVKLNWFNRALLEGRTIGSAFPGGTYASPYFSKSFFDKSPSSHFHPFENPYHYLLQVGDRQKWFDTKVPYTSVDYVKGGRSESEENNFHFLFSTNLGKKINFGGAFDYDYANGIYDQTKSKNITYRLFGSYEGERYKAYVSGGNTNVINFESGGITDDRYITAPTEFEDGKRTFLPKDIPTKFQRTWNRNVFGNVRFHHRYSLGFKKEEKDERDSVKTVFVPVTTIFNDISYKKHRRRFVSEMSNITDFYKDVYISSVRDEEEQQSERYYPNERHKAQTFSITAGLALEEGFHKWVKMGLAAYARWERDYYLLPKLIDEELPLDIVENTTYIGARLSTSKGKRVNYYVKGELGVLGKYIGDVYVDGDFRVKIPIKGRDYTARFFGELENKRTPFSLRHFHNTFYFWENDFDPVQRLRLGGELKIPLTSTRLKATIETIQNPIYVGKDSLPAQFKGNFRAIGLNLAQDLRIGAFNWENEVMYQLFSEKELYYYPSLLVHSNLYFKTLIAKVMTLQLGLDAYWHTAYKAPYYEPASQLLVPQDEVEIGGRSPLVNGYASVHLKRTRFFVMYYNMAPLLFKPDHFSLPHYPTYPPMLRMGIIVDFRN